MVIFNFIGYFTLVLCDLPHVQISQVLSLCYTIPTSLLLSQDSGLDCFLLILLPAIMVLYFFLLSLAILIPSPRAVPGTQFMLDKYIELIEE
jgi:hypothetical protein